MNGKPIVTVTLNPALDLTVELNELKPGEVNLALNGHLYPAGKGINVATVLRDLGEQVVVTGVLGAANRRPFDELFEEKSLENQFVYESGTTRINVKLSEARQRITDINLPGLSVQQTTIQQLHKCIEQLSARSDLFILSGSLPKGLDPQVYAQLIGLLRSHDCKVIVDTSGLALRAAVGATPTMVKPNVEEMEQWAGRRLATIAEQEDIVREWLQQGIHHVVVSDGAKGVRWYSKNGSWQALPPTVDVVSTVGAGDSLVAGLAYGLANDWEVEDTLVTATAVSALAVTQVGVGISTQPDKFDELKQKVTVKPLGFLSLRSAYEPSHCDSVPQWSVYQLYGWDSPEKCSRRS